MRKLEGYHFGVLCCAVVAAVVLLINVILTIWAVSGSGVQNGLGTLLDGSCKRTATLTFWMHLAINVLSTLLLGASNYSMQCLSSPTRSEIDKAHGQGVWLDIGVPSVKNLRRLSTDRIVLWWLLALSSIPLHLLYNSAVFSSLSTRRYNLFLVSNDFLDGAPFNVSPMLGSEVLDSTIILQGYQNNQTSLVRLENKACLEAYTAPIISANSDLLLVSTYSDSTNSLLYCDVYQDSQLIRDSTVDASGRHAGNCSLSILLLTKCDPSRVMNNAQDWSIGIGNGSGSTQLAISYELAPSLLNETKENETRVQYCLSKREEEHCKLQFSLAIMIVVIICNLIKTICMSSIAWKQDLEPLVTLGDAIASFLDRPDVTTDGNCIAGKTQFRKGRSWGLHLSRWNPKLLRWCRAASLRRWLFCNIL